MKMMKPEMDIVRFGAEDVIATSGAALFTHTVTDESGKTVDLSTLDTIGEIIGLSDYGGLWLTTNEEHGTCHAYFYGDIEGAEGVYSTFVPYQGGLSYNSTATELEVGNGKGWYYSDDNGVSWTFCGSN